MNVGIVDYDAGNLTSVVRALNYLNIPNFVSANPKDLEKADRIIFPGDGHAATSMQVLSQRGLDVFLKTAFKQGLPILGICVGSQVILDQSDEKALNETKPTPCLGLISGACKRLPAKSGLKVPHMGWNTLKQVQAHPIFNKIPQDSSFFFVHSYYTLPQASENILGTTEYGLEFPSGLVKDNLVAFQFHPEKSGPIGLKLLENFIFWKI